MIFLIYGLTIALAQLCDQTNKIDKYTYQSPATASNGWNYDMIAQISPCTAATSDLKGLKTSDVSLLPLKISLDIPPMLDQITPNTAAPYTQYLTNQIRLVSQDLNNLVSYQSVYFTFGPSEHLFDFQNKPLDAELQITFIQEKLYDLCDSEPMYAVLAIPLFTITEEQREFASAIKFNGTSTTQFDFRTNVFSGLKSDMISYLSYKAALNVPGCSLANWFVLTSPLFIKQSILKPLLALNQLQTLKRVTINTQNLSFVKGKVIYEGDDALKDYDDTVEWAATWVASIVPCLFFAIIVCIYGQYELSNIGRYKRPDKRQVGLETEALHQEDALEKLA